MRCVILGVLVLSGVAGAAAGPFTLSLRQEPCPVVGMSRYIVTASGDEPVNTFSDLTITGSAHQVWDAVALGGPPSPQIGSLLGRPADWYDADTCLLVVDDTLGDDGTWFETNDDSLGGSGLSLFAGAFAPVTGMGTYGHTGWTSEGLDDDQEATPLDFMQVVIPSTSVVYMSGRLHWGEPGGIAIDLGDFDNFAIPEPAMLSLLTLGGLAVLRCRRRSGGCGDKGRGRSRCARQ